MAKPEREMSKSDRMAAERKAKAGQRSPMFLGTFELIERPAQARGVVEPLGKVHEAILNTPQSKQAVKVPLGEGQDATKLFRHLRKPMRAHGKLVGFTLRRVVGPNYLAMWVEPRKPKGEKKAKSK